MKTRRLWGFVAGVGLLTGAAAGAEGQGDLTVVVTGLENDAGKVMIAVIDSAESYDKEDRAARSVAAVPSGGGATVTFEDLDYGTYAVKVFHDENVNGKLDTNFVGMPVERFGFSNNATGRFGPPDFADAKFDLDRPALRLDIEARGL